MRLATRILGVWFLLATIAADSQLRAQQQEEKASTAAIEMAADIRGVRLLRLESRFGERMSLLPSEGNYLLILTQPVQGTDRQVVRWAFQMYHNPRLAEGPFWSADLHVDSEKNVAYVVLLSRTEAWKYAKTDIFRVDLSVEAGSYPIDFTNTPKDKWPQSAKPMLTMKEEDEYQQWPTSVAAWFEGDSALLSYAMKDREKREPFRRYRYYRLDLTTLKWREVQIEKKVEKQPPAVPGTVRWNEESTVAVLRQIAGIENDWPSRYAVFGSGYWVADVYGMYGIGSPDSPRALVTKEIARTDRFPLPASTRRGTSPTDPLYVDPPLAAPVSYNGYLFESLINDESGKPYHADPKSNTYHNPSKFGFRAIPVEHGKTGTRTFQVNEKGVVYAKDLGLGAEKNPPRGSWEGGAEPEKSGWTVVE